MFLKKYKVLVFAMVVILSLSSIISVYADGTLKKGDRGEEVTKLQNFLKKNNYFNEKASGYFGDVTEAAVIAFQKAQKLTADGVVGAGTLKQMIKLGYDGSTFAKNTAAKKSKVELLDWWREASSIFKLNTVATVTDVWTGKQYKIVRTYGTNHADCETLTANDTKIMKSIWGGKWSWDRRPSIIEVNGRRIAASIAAMPHAGVDSVKANKTVSSRSGGYSRGINMDKIKNNNMDGVFDVHFLNSKTHGTNKVDKKHQEMTKKAAAN